MKLHTVLKSKLHHARISYCNPEYVGSIEIDAELMKKVGILNGEKVEIWAVDHPARISTYAMAGPRGVVGMNGGAARFFNQGDRVIIVAYVHTDENIDPKILLLNEENEVQKELEPYSVLG
jgi:aspartate 1-decarboxylase